MPPRNAVLLVGCPEGGRARQQGGGYCRVDRQIEQGNVGAERIGRVVVENDVPAQMRKLVTIPEAADCRDQIIRAAREPWRPAAIQPYDPAVLRPRQAASPDAGIEPGR